MEKDYIEFRTHYIRGTGVYYGLFIAGMLSAFSFFLILLAMDKWITLSFFLPTHNVLSKPLVKG